MKRPNVVIRLGLGLALVTAPLTALALTVPALVNAASAGPPAAFTTTDVSQGTGACLNGGPGLNGDVTNCNQYASATDVWLNGGPSQLVSGAGTYFFAVLDPSGQGDPNDLVNGSPNGNLLSTDLYGNRTFTVNSAGQITSYGGTHTVDYAENKIQLAPFNPTGNPGGVYIMAICALSGTQPVAPKDCKYDAFKVQGINPPPFDQFSDPTVIKSASLDYTSTANWTITKTAAAPTSVETSSSTASFSYTVTVTKTGSTITDVVISGNIDVFNPNTESDLVTTSPMNLSGLTDTLSGDSNNATCVIAGGSPDLTLSSADTTYPYTCDLGTYLPTGEVDNTATATWDAQSLDNGASATAGSAFWEVPVTVDSPTLKDQSVTVTDPNAPNPPYVGGVLGTFTDSGFVTYSIGWPVVADTCTSYTNTATMVTFDSGVSTPASATVSVCGPASGGLTIGFWQNKNGQAILTGGQALLGVCRSGTYLRSFAPFKDLSGTATCSAVAKYVANVIKLANASGSSMNAMLKAQMLATALDVYFSGNEGDPLHSISLGGVKIDLTHIWGSNDSAAFSNTCETVNQMLADASATAANATVSNPLASPWYGQVKSTQGKAETSFDAVNNGAAFSC